MLIDICIAFLLALILYVIRGNYKKFVTLVFSLTIIIIYFLNGYHLDFIGDIDFSVWILFIVLFDILLTYLEAAITKLIKKL